MKPTSVLIIAVLTLLGVAGIIVAAAEERWDQFLLGAMSLGLAYVVFLADKDKDYDY